MSAAQTIETVADKQLRAMAMMQERGLDVSQWHNVYSDAEMTIRQECLDAVFGALHTAALPLGTVNEAGERLSIDEARDQLRNYIAEREMATHYASVAATAVQRAKLRVQNLSDQINQYTGLDEDILAHNVAAIKEDREATLPASLLHSQEQRGKVADRFSAAQAALDRLMQEARACDSDAVRAGHRVAQAAVLVLQALMHERVDDLLSLEGKAKHLRSELISFGTAWFEQTASGPRPAQMSPAIVQLLREPPCNANAVAEQSIVVYFQDIHKSLCSDPDVTLD